MLKETTPDSVPDSFSGDNAQESGLKDVQRTSSNSTIADDENQEIPEIPTNFHEPSPDDSFRNGLRTPGKYAGTGNRCGHDPSILRDVPLQRAEYRPIIIQKLIKASDKLNNRPWGSKKAHGELILVRSEGRESLVQYAKILFYHLELSTMTARLNDINFERPTLKDLISDAALTGLSHSRAKRAERELIKRGCLRITRSSHHVNGEFMSDPSTREVTPKFFQFLGYPTEYDKQRHYKTKRLEKKGIKGAFKKGILAKFKESLSSGSHHKNKEGVKTGSFPENKENQAERQKLINLYVEVCQKKGVDLSTTLLRSAAQKMTTENIIRLLKYHTADTS